MREATEEFGSKSRGRSGWEVEKRRVMGRRGGCGSVIVVKALGVDRTSTQIRDYGGRLGRDETPTRDLALRFSGGP